MGFIAKIINALKKTKGALSQKLSDLFKKGIDAEFFEELEEVLISSDAGVSAAVSIVEELEDEVRSKRVKDPEQVRTLLKEILVRKLDFGEWEVEYPCALLITGVNGVGKTTTIGKLAAHFTRLKKRVIVAAGDTFRAAASDQLTVWAERADVRIVKHAEGADPSAVVFDAVAAAKAKRADVLLVDTAGRLHNKTNLMEELKKIDRVIGREYPEAAQYNLIVLDATTGQNAVAQVKAFNEAVDLQGIVLTKLDGTAKGGAVIAVTEETELPVLFVGVGEKLDDLVLFDAESFAEGIL